MKIKHIFISLFVFCGIFTTSAQQLFHQDIFHGGVTAAGYSGGVGGVGQGSFEIHIEPGSTIKNAYIFLYTAGNPPNSVLALNSNSLSHNDFIELGTVSHTFLQFLPIKYYVLDVTDIVDPSENYYTTTIFEASTGPDLNWGWWNPVLYVEYENPALDKVSTALYVNDQDLLGFETYTFDDLNPIETSLPVGFSVFTDRACNNYTNSSSSNDGNEVVINGNTLGFIGTPDSVANSFSRKDCSGSRGHFYYQNETLFGLNDDFPNSTMDGADALADISSYLTGPNNAIDLTLIHTHSNPTQDRPNNHMFFPLAYTTPCDTFSTQIIADTSVCIGDSIQLFASGGNNYEWLNTQGLSNPNISSPMASPDSTQLYVVRIENELGCFRTEKVHVEVHENPIIESLDINPEICGESNGEVTVAASGNNPLNYTIDGITQTSASFSDLLSDNYTITVTGDNGCTADSSFTLPQEIGVDASFIANPESGYEPLTVQFTNTSLNATDYEWYIDDAYWDNTTHTSAYFDTAGVYDVMLYAYNNIPECQDSFALKIIVEDTMTVRIPNVFTPNGDNSNDLFTIDVRRAQEIHAIILNRWGNVMHETTQQSNGTNQTITIWDGNSQSKPATEGTYFYKFEITDVKGEIYNYQGFFQLVRD